MTIRPGLDEVKKLLDTMYDVMVSKGGDYSGDGVSTFASFERQSEFSGIPVNKVFMVLIGVKVARLRSLNSSGRIPNNESLNDSVLDLANYCVLYLAYQQYKENQNASRVDPANITPSDLWNGPLSSFTQPPAEGSEVP